MKGDIQMSQCKDSFLTQFSSFDEMYDFHTDLAASTSWLYVPLASLAFFPLSEDTDLTGLSLPFHPDVSEEAISDTMDNTKLAVSIENYLWPVRDTAYKTILDRARVNGNSLPKISKELLSGILTNCCQLYRENALVLVRDQKVAAIHGGGENDYSVLPVDRLLRTLQDSIDSRFPGNTFLNGYSDHALTSAKWSMPEQTEELLGTYLSRLSATGDSLLAEKLTPGITFTTSDTGVSGAKVSAYLCGKRMSVNIGSCIQVDHRSKRTVEDFRVALDGLFVKFGDAVGKLMKLMDIRLDYPVNAMTRVCKTLKMPTKAACEAVAMFEMATGSGPATAHEVYMAMQEILFLCRVGGMPENKLLTVSENLSRALTIKWNDYDLAKGVNL